MGNMQCIPCICGQPRDRYVHQSYTAPCHQRLYQCVCVRDKFRPLPMLGTYRWSLILKTYSKHGLSAAQLEKLFKRSCMPDGSNPGNVRLRNWNRQFECSSTRMLLRVTNPKGRDIRYLFYEQFLEMVFDFCGAGHGELPRTTWQLFNPDLQKVSPSKVGAIMRFVWGEDFGAKHPELHKWVLRVHVDTFKQVRVEKLGRDDGREKRDKGEWVSTSELEEFLLRYPVLMFPIMSLQRMYFRRTFGEKFWYAWHCKRNAPETVAPEGYFVDNMPHARMLSGRMFMLETILCRELRLRRWEGPAKLIPALESLRPRLEHLDARGCMRLIYAASRSPTTQCLACGHGIVYAERTVHAYTRKQDVPASVATADLGSRAGSIQLPAVPDGRRSVRRKASRATTVASSGGGSSSGEHTRHADGGSSHDRRTARDSIADDASSLRSGHLRLADRRARRSRQRSRLSMQLDMDAVADAKSRLDKLLANPKRLDTGFCTACEKAVQETLAHRYGYAFARGVLEFAKVQKVPTDVENWAAGRRYLDQTTQYAKVKVPAPDFALPHTLVESKTAPDDVLTELEIWYRFYDEGTEEYFYYNIATGEAQWEEPDEYMLSEENQLGLKEEDVLDQVEAEDAAVKTHRI